MNFLQDLVNDFSNVEAKNIDTNILNDVNNKNTLNNLKLDTFLWLIILFIIIGLIIYCFCKSNFTNKNKNNNKKSVSFKDFNFEDDLIMICNDVCPYSNKMKENLILVDNKINNKKVKFIQYNSDKGTYLRNKHSILGTPALINFENNKPLSIILGYSPLEDIFKKLNGSVEEPTQNNNNNNGVDELLLIGNNYCGFCKKQKDLYDSKNIKYRFIDSNSQEGMNFMKKHNSNGVPLLINIKNGQEQANIGYSETFP